jgi:hypothetical protein
METVIQGKHGPKVVNLNRRKAIRQLCLNCSAWVLSDVRKCAFGDCSLWHFRIGAGKQDPDVRKQAIRNYCLSCGAGQQVEVYKCPVFNCPLWFYRKADRELPRKYDSIPGKGHIGTFQSLKTKGHTQVL